LSSVSIAASGAFAEYAQPVFQRCLTIIHTTLTQYQQAEANPEQFEEPDRTFIVVCLDLLSGLTQGLGDVISQLIATNQPPLLHLMAVCLTVSFLFFHSGVQCTADNQHPEAAVRQSAHALLGDMAISCFDLLRPVVPQIMPSVIQQIETEPAPESVSVCNNAAWATGEIALQSVGDSSLLEPFIPELMNRLGSILLNPKSQKSLAENAAVTIGRLGLVTPALIAPQLPSFAQAWCTALWEIKDNEEKDSAFRGFCMMIASNPSGIQDVCHLV
jgi:transportin-1